MTSVNKQRITLFLAPTIVKQAKAQAVVEEQSLTGLVEKALVAYLPLATIVEKVKLS